MKIARITANLTLLCAIANCDGGGDGSNGDFLAQSRTSLCKSERYPIAEDSMHILPYSVGEEYKVGQGNCVPTGTGSHAKGTRAEFAYDILMPIGTSLLATREGVVIYVEEDFVDGTGVPGEENTIVIQHIDDTVSNYGHLTTLGALVEEGDWVNQGDLIGMSGHSGASSDPHLHYEILACDGDVFTHIPVVSFSQTCRSVPVTFNNTQPNPNGLIEGESYMPVQLW